MSWGAKIEARLAEIFLGERHRAAVGFKYLPSGKNGMLRRTVKNTCPHCGRTCNHNAELGRRNYCGQCTAEAPIVRSVHAENYAF